MWSTMFERQDNINTDRRDVQVCCENVNEKEAAKYLFIRKVILEYFLETYLGGGGVVVLRR